MPHFYKYVIDEEKYEEILDLKIDSGKKRDQDFFDKVYGKKDKSWNNLFLKMSGGDMGLIDDY